MSVEHLVPISERRGAVVAGALACAVLLVVGYGSGIGVVPSDPGGLAGAEPLPGGDTGSGTVSPLTPGATGGRTGASLVTSSRPSRGGAGSTRAPSITQVPRTMLGGLVAPPTSGTAPSRSTIPGTRPPSTSPPGTVRPPGTAPPSCTSLVGALVQGLVGYLAGPNPDAALVQQVSDVLGLRQLLPTGSLLGLAGVTPLLDSVVATLGSTLRPVTDAVAPSGTPDASLVPALRTLLGVDVTGIVTVSAEELLRLLGAVLGGC